MIKFPFLHLFPQLNVNFFFGSEFSYDLHSQHLRSISNNFFAPILFTSVSFWLSVFCKIFDSVVHTELILFLVYFKVKEVTKKIAKRFEISGPLNIQFLAKGDDIMVCKLACNDIEVIQFS